MQPNRPKINRPPTKTPEQALATLMQLCARGEKSSGDALRLMQRWDVAPAERPSVLQKLLESRFIDDRRFADAFIQDKTHLNGWGAHRIRTALQRKGVATEIIEEKLRELDPASAHERLVKQLEKKRRLTTRYKDMYDLKTKLLRYGLSLGYDYDAVRDTVEKLIRPCDDEF